MGDKVLGNQIYFRLRNISSTNKTDDIQNFKIFINASKEKKSTVKDSAGKILEYKITLNTNIIINDFLTDEAILKQEFSTYSNYKVQDQHSETKNLENKTLENLITAIANADGMLATASPEDSIIIQADIAEMVARIKEKYPDYKPANIADISRENLESQLQTMTAEAPIVDQGIETLNQIVTNDTAQVVDQEALAEQEIINKSANNNR